MKALNYILKLLTLFTAAIGLCAITLVCFILLYTKINGNFPKKETLGSQPVLADYDNGENADIPTDEPSIPAVKADISAAETSIPAVETDVSAAETSISAAEADVLTAEPSIRAAENPPAVNTIVNGTSYILNTSSNKFHYPSCYTVEDISPENYAVSNLSREELIAAGYTPCKKCYP